MTDASIRRWGESLPVPARAGAASLLLSMHTPAEMKHTALALAKRGYLGCVPFAHTEGDEIVARLVPGKSVADAPVGIAWKSTIDAMTIAPRLKHFVAGRLAQIDCARKSFEADAAALAGILEYAKALGGEESARMVLEARPKAAKVEDPSVRRGMLWGAAKSVDPLFEALAGAWMYEGDELGAWLRKARGKVRDQPITVRLRVCYHSRGKTDADVSEDAWSVVNGDHVFDNTYTGSVRGHVLGSRKTALVFAVSWLRANATDDPRFESPAWAAAQVAVDDPRYDGEVHHRLAGELADKDPQAAYVQLANAAAYAARARSRTIAGVIASARSLAKAGGWEELEELLAA